jgi:hypothetical protein
MFSTPNYQTILKNSYDLCKILRIQPSEYQSMTVTRIRHFIETLSRDIEAKDQWIVPRQGIQM